MHFMHLLAWFLAVQDPDAALARKCDSQIPWIADGTELIDMELAAGHHPQYPEAREPKNYKVDRSALLAKARAEAARKNRLILWYCPRVSGLHMYRAILPDRYMKSVAFTDPGVVDLVTSKFVPLRMCSDPPSGAPLGIQAFDFVEPGFIFLTPEGKVVHKIDRIRTFNADWIRSALIAVLRENPSYNRPIGDSVEELLRGGDDDQAYDRATNDQRAVILRRKGKFAEVFHLDCSDLQKGWALLGLKRFEEARRKLERVPGAEAAYALAGIDAWTGQSPDRHLRRVMTDFPDSPWAWKAASNLHRAEDSLPEGPLSHHLEDFFLVAPEGAPPSTRFPAKDSSVAVNRALNFLLRAQWEDGTWRDARYSYWPDPKILPNVFTAVTAVGALALLEWRELAPDRIDQALKKADAYLRDPGHTAPDQHEESYAHAFRLHYFARTKNLTAMAPIVSRLAAMQDQDGFWCHEYQNPFSTAAVVHALAVARAAGADVPEVLFRRAAGALLSTRGDHGRQSYRVGEPPDNEKSTSARTALCEMALAECGRPEITDVAAGVERFWKFSDRLGAVRVCDYHSDGRLAGFFFFHAHFHTLEATRTLSGGVRQESLKRFRETLLSIPEWDGSFVDSHEIGKSYGTAMALILFARSRE
jgi:hypothetical protein